MFSRHSIMLLLIYKMFLLGKSFNVNDYDSICISFNERNGIFFVLWNIIDTIYFVPPFEVKWKNGDH